ncbi:heat shock protein DNAJ, putative [Babesia bigemina]|uniref:Heat shock protein DNAJ, putative n=1 Tax=Babesia bigemina TaxID=5866 RepID=A0A061D6A7_BABBI|nr:heat shock protein DNAJ, putative [Babesia bigemina]CDR94464.1 heat shock protein DNAJ, putative [Babesia bigemina]|eukprot:XP_012766650.1 heat shock protein DNAJ, putative [Babesia bigemina]
MRINAVLCLSVVLWLLLGAGNRQDPEGLYAVLGVEPDASIDEIKRKYKALAIKWHPDKNPTNAAKATEMFQKISTAYETLSDPKKRREYDDMGDFDIPLQWSRSTSSSRRHRSQRRHGANSRRQSDQFAMSSSVITRERTLPDGSVEITTTEEIVGRDGTVTRKSSTEIRPPRHTSTSRRISHQPERMAHNMRAVSTSFSDRQRGPRNSGHRDAF